MSDAKAAIAIDPNLGLAHAYLGLAKLENGQRDGESDCDVAVQKSPDSPEVYRIRALLRMSNAKLPQAEADMNTAVSKSGDLAFYLANRGLFSILPYGPSRQFDASALGGSGGNLTRALADGNNALKKDPNCGLAHLTMAAYHIRSRNLDTALASAESAMGASPKLVPAYEVAHWIVFRRQAKKAEGLKVLDRGIGQVPTSPHLRFIRGEARHEQSEYDGAIEDFTELIRLAPNEPRPYELRARSLRQRLRAGDIDAATRDELRASELRARK